MIKLLMMLLIMQLAVIRLFMILLVIQMMFMILLVTNDVHDTAVHDNCDVTCHQLFFHDYADDAVHYAASRDTIVHDAAGCVELFMMELVVMVLLS
jgi:hypothetical protein